MPERYRAPRCATTPGERVAFGVAALIVGSAAVSLADNLLCAIPAGICATFLAIGAITGWCPTALLRLPVRRAKAHNSLGYPESLQRIDTRG